MKPRAFLAIAGVCALFAAGCGGGGDDEPTTPTVAATPEATTLSKAELLQQGDAICAEVNAAVGTIASSSSNAASRVAQEADLYEGMVERIRELGEPDDDAAGYEEFIGAADALAKAQSDAAQAAARGDSAGLEEAQSAASSALQAFQSAAEAYGFEECGAEPSAPAAAAGKGGTAEEEAPGGAPEEAAPEPAPEAEPAPEETGGAGAGEAGGAEAGGGTSGGAESGGGGGSGGIGPG